MARSIDLGGHPGLAIRPRDAKAMLVLAHGAGAGMTHSFMTTIAEALGERGIATLRWDMPFMAAGKKRTDPAPVAEAAVREVVAHVARTEKLPLFAGGKSFGGRMTSRAHAAAALPVRGLIFFGFPLHPPEQPEKASERAAHLPSTTGPLLFLQGTRDDLADLALLRPIVDGIGAKRATLHVVEHADHGFDVLVRSGRTGDDVIDEIAGVAAKWMLGKTGVPSL